MEIKKYRIHDRRLNPIYRIPYTTVTLGLSFCKIVKLHHIVLFLKCKVFNIFKQLFLC